MFLVSCFVSFLFLFSFFHKGSDKKIVEAVSTAPAIRFFNWRFFFMKKRKKKRKQVLLLSDSEMANRVASLHGHLHPSPASSPSSTDSLQAERQTSTFNSEALTLFLEGGPKHAMLKASLLKLLEADPMLRERHADLSRVEQRHLAARIFFKYGTILRQQPDEESRRILSSLISSFDPVLSTRFAVQVCVCAYVLFDDLRGLPNCDEDLLRLAESSL